MKALYELMESYNWDYSQLDEKDMFYHRAIHIVAAAIRMKDKNYHDYLREQMSILRTSMPSLQFSREIMLEQAKSLAKLKIPLYIVEKSGGFKFEGKEKLQGNIGKFENKSIVWGI
jgi:hypothetical protein